MSNQNFRYTELAAKARTNAMNEVRDFADAELTKYQAQLEEAKAESYKEAIDDMALGRKTNAIIHSLNEATAFKGITDDDLGLITFLQKDTFEFLESGELIATSAAQPERQVLDFDQYQGDWFNKYTAESEDFTYEVIKMHADRTFTIQQHNKSDPMADKKSEEVGSVGHAMRLLQERHTVHLKAKAEQLEAA